MLTLIAALKRTLKLRHCSGLLAAASLALAACGGGGDPVPPVAPAAVQTDGTRTARATIGSAGGSLSVTTADGRRFTLTVPPGALSAATEITATPVVSMGVAPLAAGYRSTCALAQGNLVRCPRSVRARLP